MKSEVKKEEINTSAGLTRLVLTVASLTPTLRAQDLSSPRSLRLFGAWPGAASTPPTATCTTCASWTILFTTKTGATSEARTRAPRGSVVPKSARSHVHGRPDWQIALGFYQIFPSLSFCALVLSFLPSFRSFCSPSLGPTPRRSHGPPHPHPRCRWTGARARLEALTVRSRRAYICRSRQRRNRSRSKNDKCRTH